VAHQVYPAEPTQRGATQRYSCNQRS